ncbi:hypothetical protein FA15DRAFT_232742 [Coprinopsis marcescibilis]|uniref:GATA-type domain-containing protein n=1 Tax=Coprinopsis marcescibilis TaxID=230819 RepID=A0A5C3KFP8_COPMA|nr:hypothetical protein FA15DRAFT_232742 [Coprinopsis marcescibilis]
MPSILNLKFKGNKSFVPFSNLNDTEALTKTWKVCTKVASFLEQGQRLENLSWRLWHLQNLMVDTDNAKSKREFRKLSKCMGDKLDKEKGRSIEELEAPDFKRNHSVELIRQRAAEKERIREAKPGTIKRMQFTFSIDPVPAPTTTTVRRPTVDFNRKARPAVRSTQDAQQHTQVDEPMGDAESEASHSDGMASSAQSDQESASLKFPSLFSNDFGPHALLYPTPTLTNTMTYGEGHLPSTSTNNDSFSIARPTIELPLDELLHSMDSDSWISSLPTRSNPPPETTAPAAPQEDVTMAPPHSQGPPTTTVPLVSNKRTAAMAEAVEPQPTLSETTIVIPARPMKKHTRSSSKSFSQANAIASSSTSAVPPLSQAVREVLPETVAPSKVNELFSNTHPSPSTSTSTGSRSSGRPSLTVRTQATPVTRSSGPGATATTTVPTTTLRSTGNSAPGGVKAECSNCGATHTPLWRRGLNDELNCNACGLYCKLHKRPRPKSMRNNHGEGRAPVQPRQETVDVMAQCYNCHTTATPLWRKDDEGKTVCNACGLYYKLHGSARPISMKSDVIRKRSRHDARRANSVEETLSTSPGASSQRNSPVPDNGQHLGDVSSNHQYDFNEEMDFRQSNSELMNALGPHDPTTMYNAFSMQSFPGPYSHDYLGQIYPPSHDSLPFSHVEPTPAENDPALSPRSSKRRRMSTDSASDPPLSAVSFAYSDGYSPNSSGSSHSQQNAMEFPFSTSPTSGPALRGSGNTFWHPPMLPQGDEHSQLFHPPMMVPHAAPNHVNNHAGSSDGSEHSGSDESPMDYLQPPMMSEEDQMFSAYIHPPMALPEDANVTMNNSNSNNNNNNNNTHNTLHYDYGHSYEHDTSMRVY